MAAKSDWKYDEKTGRGTLTNEQYVVQLETEDGDRQGYPIVTIYVVDKERGMYCEGTADTYELSSDDSNRHGGWRKAFDTILSAFAGSKYDSWGIVYDCSEIVFNSFGGEC